MGIGSNPLKTQPELIVDANAPLAGAVPFQRLHAIGRRHAKIIKNRGHFPTDEAAIKLLYLGIRNVTGRHIDGDGLVLERGQRGTGTLGWKAAMNAFAVTFPDRVPV